MVLNVSWLAGFSSIFATICASNPNSLSITGPKLLIFSGQQI